MDSSNVTATNRGLFDGFERYRSASDADYARVMTQGIVALDANVLLNLYRYNAQTRQDLLNVLKALGDQLLIPHQVLAEFWRNREEAIRDPVSKGEDTIKDLTKRRDESITSLRTWANRVALPEDARKQHVRALNECFDALVADIERHINRDEVSRMHNTNEDPVVLSLDAVLRGKLGEPFPAAEHEKVVQEGLRRVDKNIPPGYRDKGKKDSGEAPAGDYLVWEQLLRAAEARKRDVLFVTADVKEDWWRRESGELRGPRLELIDEMRGRAGVRLFMVRPESLLKLAESVLKVSVSKESVEDAERVERSRAAEGWTRDGIATLLERLEYEGPVQARVLRRAAESGGTLSRNDVYEIGEYDENRSLRGFTRPIRRITQDLRDSGEVTSDLEVLEVAYEGSQASNFTIRPELLPLVREVYAEGARATQEGETSGSSADP